VRQEALQNRPERHAADAQLSAAETGLDLSRLLYLPDFNLTVGYNSMMQMPEFRPLLGVSAAVPIGVSRRKGAIRQAEAELSRARSEAEQVKNRVGREADEAWLRVEEIRQTALLYRDVLLPTARRQLEAARTGYETGRNDFTPLIQSEKNYQTLELEYELAVARLYAGLAELDRSVGLVPGLGENGENR
jgi:outer membrane protein TolC